MKNFIHYLKSLIALLLVVVLVVGVVAYFDNNIYAMATGGILILSMLWSIARGGSTERLASHGV